MSSFGPALASVARHAWLVLAASALDAGELRLEGVAAARGVYVEGRQAWIDGGFGRLTEGGAADAFESLARAEAQLGIEWTPSEVWLLRLHGTARTEPDAAGGARAGLTEAMLQFRPELRPGLALRFRGGLLFLPTSRENTDPLWQSPYTLTLSALNAWIGEEMRPIGLDAALLTGEAGGSRVELAGMAFGASDTAGTLLAWRGWAMGTRLSVVGETLPLPPLPTLAPGAAFGEQQAEGTQPIEELDDRVGWHVRGRWSRAGIGLLQAAWTDTRGDRALHQGQYAWATRFASFGAEAQLGRIRLVTEGLWGETGMGLRSGPHVDLGIRAGYALLTWSSAGDSLRLTARYDAFENEDEDDVAEPNEESGWAMTLAALYAPRPWVRIGLEYLDLRGDRPAAAFAGTPAGAAARRAQAELRLRF
jgi:hypothetical protein